MTDGRMDAQIADSKSAYKMCVKNDYKDDKMVN